MQQCECDQSCFVSAKHKLSLPFLFLCTTCSHTHTNKPCCLSLQVHLLQTFKLEQTQTQSQEKQYISEHPLASWGLCPNSVLKQLHLAIHHGDRNLSLSHPTATDSPSSHTQAPRIYIDAPSNSGLLGNTARRNKII